MTATVPASHRAALFALCDRIPHGWPWAVTASANLALRWFDVSPGDVDVTADGETVYDVADLFSEAVVRPVRPPASEPGDRIRSHFGALELGGSEVELMGEVEHRIDGEWVRDPPVAATREFLSVGDGDRRVPAMGLDYEARGYRARGEHDRAARIERRL